MTETKLRLSKSRVSAKVRSVTSTRRRIDRHDRGSVRNSNRRRTRPKDFAMEAVLFLKSKHAHSMVEVKDLQSEDATAVALRCGRRYETLDATRGPGCPRSSSLTSAESLTPSASASSLQVLSRGGPRPGSLVFSETGTDLTEALGASRSAHWQICPQPAYLSLRTPLNLAFFFCAMN